MTDRKKSEKYQDYIKTLDKQLYTVEEKLGFIKKEFDEASRKAKKEVDEEANQVEEKVESINQEVSDRAQEQREAINKNHHELALFVKQKAGKDNTDLDMLKHRMQKIEHKLKQEMISHKRKRENI